MHKEAPTLRDTQNPRLALSPLCRQTFGHCHCFLAWEIFRIQLEELAFLCGLKAIFLQVVSIKSPFYKVFFNSRCSCLQEEFFGGQGCVYACRSSVINIRLELEASQVRDDKFWDHFLYLHKLSIRGIDAGSLGTPALDEGAWSPLACPLAHPIRSPHQALRNGGQETHAGLCRRQL